MKRKGLFSAAVALSVCGFDSPANAQYLTGGAAIRGTTISGRSISAPDGVTGAPPAFYPGRSYRRFQPWTRSTYVYDPNSNSWYLQSYNRNWGGR